MPARPLRADGQPVGTSVGISASSLSKQSSLLTSLSSTVKTMTQQQPATARPVFAQIIRQQNPAAITSLAASSTASPSPLSSSSGTASPRVPIMVPRTITHSHSPLILGRQSRVHDPVVNTTLASIPSPLSLSERSTPALVSKPALPSFLSLRQSQEGRRKRDTPVRASAQLASGRLELAQQLSRTVVQPAESEAMDVDVGQPVVKMELPPHLTDHSYSIYNPEEAERQKESFAQGHQVACSIPPARLSYAPQLPDSPTTLHKLLKVFPKKNSRQSLGSTPPRSFPSRSPSHRMSRGRGGRRSTSRGGRRGRGGARKSGSISRTGSEEESRASSSDQSDSEESSKVCTCVYM